MPIYRVSVRGFIPAYSERDAVERLKDYQFDTSGCWPAGFEATVGECPADYDGPVTKFTFHRPTENPYRRLRSSGFMDRLADALSVLRGRLIAIPPKEHRPYTPMFDAWAKED